MGTKTRERIGLIITNSQNMFICDISMFLKVFNTLWTHMFIISSILTVTQGGSNDIYDDVSSKARGRGALVDLLEIFAMLRECSWNGKS